MTDMTAGTAQASSGLVKTAGYVVLAFAAVGVYLFFNALSLATGGRAIPLGSPILRGSHFCPNCGRTLDAADGGEETVIVKPSAG